MRKPKTTRSIRVVAMDLLARREHSAQELAQKLQQRDFDADAIEATLEDLQHENLQSDARYLEALVNQRVNSGYGPVKIKQELRQKGVGSDAIDEYFSELDIDWGEVMRVQRCRKFGAEIPQDYREKMKQARFLQNRGFSPESVMRLFR